MADEGARARRRAAGRRRPRRLVVDRPDHAGGTREAARVRASRRRRRGRRSRCSSSSSSAASAARTAARPTRSSRTSSARRRAAACATATPAASRSSSSRRSDRRRTSGQGGDCRLVLDVTAHRLGALDRVEPRDEVERHVDPGRHTRCGDDVAVIDETRLDDPLSRRVPRVCRERSSAWSPAGRPAVRPLRTRVRRCRHLPSAIPSLRARRTRSRNVSSAWSGRVSPPGSTKRSISPTSSHVVSGRTLSPCAQVTGSDVCATVRTLIGLSLSRAQAVNAA